MNQSTNNLSDNQDATERDGSDQIPSPSPRFQCPACRARQPLQNECRRCGADLSLIVAARRRTAFIQEQLGQATKGSPAHERYTKELQMFVGPASTSNTD